MDALKYVKHYFQMPDFALFFAVTACVIFLILLIFMIYAKLSFRGLKDRSTDAAENVGSSDDESPVSSDTRTGSLSLDDPACRKYLGLSQKFYELIFSGTSILFFVSVYYLIDWFYDYQPVKSFLIRYESFLLLALIVFSCLINTFLDRVFVRLSFLKSDDRSSLRLLGMLYMFAIFTYIKFIYEDDNYDYFIAYFLGLMIGRFIYFDASWKDFTSAIKKAASNLPILLFGLAATGVLAWYGFVYTDYLIKHIGVITNLFFCHLFMCAVIFLYHHLHLENLFFRDRLTCHVQHLDQ